jgi:hypothetical protein
LPWLAAANRGGMKNRIGNEMHFLAARVWRGLTTALAIAPLA